MANLRVVTAPDSAAESPGGLPEPALKASAAERARKSRERRALGLHRIVVEDVPDKILVEAWSLGLIETYAPKDLAKFARDCIGLVVRAALERERRRVRARGIESDP